MVRWCFIGVYWRLGVVWGVMGGVWVLSGGCLRGFWWCWVVSGWCFRHFFRSGHKNFFPVRMKANNMETRNIEKQAEAELCQAQLSLNLASLTA